MSNLPKAKDCLFYARVEAGYVFQHLVGAICQMKPEMGYMRWNITPDGIHIQTNIFKTDSSGKKEKNDVDKTEAVLLDCYLMGSKFHQFKCKHDISLEIYAKNLNDQIKTMKRKERIVFYILDKKPYETLVIYTESTVDSKEPRECSQSSIKVTVTSGVFYTRDVQDIEYDETPEGLLQVYRSKFTLPPSTYERVKRLGTKGQLTIKIQDSDYSSFTVRNKQISSKEIFIGQKDDNEEIYEGLFDMEYFSVVNNLAKIKSSLMFYAPNTKSRPLKIQIALEEFGEANIYIKDSRQIQAEINNFKLDNK